MRFEQGNNKDPDPFESGEWVEGAFDIAIDKKKGYYRHTFEELNLTISVQ